MIKNFEELKTQLKDLSQIVNGFKSEAVQLRIVELVFGLEADTEEQHATFSAPAKRKTIKKKTTKKAAGPAAPKKSGNKPSGQGAMATLGKLIEDGFLKTPKLIGDIVRHCEEKLARKFKASDFSGILARLTREDKLTRTKNAENQYEYKSK